MLIAAGGVTHLVSNGPVLLATPVALAAGVLSFFSPCCLPLLPGYLGYLGGVSGETAEPATADTHRVRAARNGARVAVLPARTTRSPVDARVRGRGPLLPALLFVLGFAAVFVSYGAAFGGIGFSLQRHQLAVNRTLGVATIAFGLLFAGLFTWVPGMRVLARTARLNLRPRIGLAGAPVLGVLFAVGWTPCIGPTLAAVLLLSSQTGTAGRGALLGFVYALGLGVPFLLVAAAAGRIMRVVGFARRHARAVMRAGGLLLVTIGVLELSGVWADLVARLQATISGTVLPW